MTLKPHLDWGKPKLQIRELHYYETPPLAWVDPTYQDIPNEAQWPWNYSPAQFPDALPSGRPFPKISVVTVTRNQGAYLEETLRSVLMQGYPNLEYIVIDGASTDNTVDILQRYSADLTYWVSEPDNGQSNALNKGFSHATGDILAWLNSDDCYLPHTFWRVALAFDTYNADMIAGGCQLRQGFNPTPFRTHHNATPLGHVVPLPLERLLDIDGCWQKGEFFYQPEVFWTRDLWERAGGYVDETLFYSMDYELWVRMASHNATIVHVPDPLVLFRVHEAQKTFGSDLPFLTELKRVGEAKQFSGSDRTSAQNT